MPSSRRRLWGVIPVCYALLLIGCVPEPPLTPTAAPVAVASAASSATPLPPRSVAAPAGPLPSPTCTPPSCAVGDALGCPGECADGCGLVCVPVPPAPADPTPRPLCTPPPCIDGEVYHCPDECPGGCGTTCATPTPAEGPEPWEQPVPAVAYTVAGNLWIAIGFNAPRMVSDSGVDGRPIFSPDGRQVLFTRQLPEGTRADDDPSLDRLEEWVIDVNGENARRLFSAPDDLRAADGSEDPAYPRVPQQIAWLPDGRHVAFSTTDSGAYGLVRYDDLWLADVETGAVARLVADGEGGTFAFSPDGGQALVADEDSVAVVSADGRTRRELLTFDPYDPGDGLPYVPQPLWLPDGSAGLLALTTLDPLGEPAACRLHHLDLAGEATIIGALPTDCIYPSRVDALWSPDRTRVAYHDAANETLVVAATDGSDPQVYTVNVSEFVGWAPDSRRFVLRIEEAGYLHLGEMGAAPVPLAAPEEVGDIWQVRWIDGETFAFLAGDLDAPTLYLASVGGEPRVIDRAVEHLAAALTH